MRNEVSATQLARGHRVVVEGSVLEVRMPRPDDLEAQRPRDKFALALRSVVELVSEGGTAVTCYLAPDAPAPPLTAGTNARLLGKFYDFKKDMNGKARMVLVLCRAQP